MIKGLLFDLDGVITETAKIHFIAWRDEVAKIGIIYTEEDNQKLKGLPRIETLRGILKMKNRIDISEEKIQEMVIAKNEAYKKMLKTDLSKKNILPGIPQFLEDAKKAGLKMAITSSSFNAPTILEKIKLKHYFDFIVNPGDANNGKPAPDIYLLGVKGLNLNIEETVGFEDAMPGVEGLRAGNIKTVAITWGDKGQWDKAQLILKSTSELDIKNILTM